MSHADAHTPSSPQSQSELPQGTTDDRPLKREAIILSNDRGRLGMLVALCSLAGVVVGFGLSNMAASMRLHHCQNARVATVYNPGVQVVAAPMETPTWLGVRVITDRQDGAYVQHVEPASPAYAAGIQAGDVIVGFTEDGCPRRVQRVHASMDLVHLVRNADVGDSAVVVVRRQGEEQTVRARLEHMPLSLYLDEVR